MKLADRFWDYFESHEHRRNAFLIIGMGALALGGYFADVQPITHTVADVVIGAGIVVDGAGAFIGAGMQQAEVLRQQESSS